MTGLDVLWAQIDKGRRGENIGLSTGIPKLDKVIGGIQQSRYITIAAQSSAGKSSLLQFIMYNLLKNKKDTDEIHFLIFSLEIPEHILLAKLMGLYCAEMFGIYLTLDDILSFQTPLSDEAYDCLKQAKLWIDSVSECLYVVDKMCNCKVLYKETLTFAEKYGKFEEDNGRKIYIPNNPRQLLIGVIDHGLLLQPSEGRTIKEEIDMTSSYMVTLKNKLNMTWFMLMQQNRDSTSMDRRKADLSEPGLNDIKSTGNVGQDFANICKFFCVFNIFLLTL